MLSISPSLSVFCPRRSNSLAKESRVFGTVHELRDELERMANTGFGKSPLNMKIGEPTSKPSRSLCHRGKSCWCGVSKSQQGVMTRNTQFEQIVSAVHSEPGRSIAAFFPRALSRLRRFDDFFEVFGRLFVVIRAVSPWSSVPERNPAREGWNPVPLPPPTVSVNELKLFAVFYDMWSRPLV